MTTKKDPLGVQPKPITGSRTFLPRNDEIKSRALAATRLLEDGWVEHPPQRAIIDDLIDYRSSPRYITDRPG